MRAASEVLPDGVIAPEVAPLQPPLYVSGRARLHAVIGSLALGGAERITIEWAVHAARRHQVRVVVLRDVGRECPVPEGIELLRLSGEIDGLPALGEEIAASGNPVALCHMLLGAERDALARGGAIPIPVLHNARPGWIEPVSSLASAARAVVVSQAARDELRAAGFRSDCQVARHLPRPREAQPGARALWRNLWQVPVDAPVIGMVGGVKPQKAYPRALRVLATLLERREIYLVILGGAVGRDGELAWRALLAQAMQLGVERYLRLPGFVTNAAGCLPAFDALLNTSRYEGLSIATLEALGSGLPVVASEVGGQGEVAAPGLRLLAFDAADEEWADAAEAALATQPALPPWLGFPSARLWTLLHLAAPVVPHEGVLFVTANLNAGGAQRSLVNLARELAGVLKIEIAVCGNSTASAFSEDLAARAIPHFRTALTRDCFDHAEALVRRVVGLRPAALCYWNVDPKVKLLVTQALSFSEVRIFDVLPGGYALEEMRASSQFQTWIGYTEADYHARLDAAVSKFHAQFPQDVSARTRCIPNGVPRPVRIKQSFGSEAPRVVVSGRVAPSKFVREIVQAMWHVQEVFPRAELHVLGSAEPRHIEYAKALAQDIDGRLRGRVHLHGARFDAPERLADYDAVVVLGEQQGCPNAVLEALAAGVPVVANDSGGTRELVIDGKTGLLLAARTPAAVAAALIRLFSDPALARRLALRGRRHVMRRHSMRNMARAYLKLFRGR